jgi:hypothetical protein
MVIRRRRLRRRNFMGAGPLARSVCPHHAEHDFRGRGLLPHRRGTYRAPDPGQHCLDFLVAGRRVVAGGAMKVADGGQASPERAGALPEAGLVGQEVLSDIARQAVMCCARPTITRPGRSMSAALELRSQA